MNSFPLVISNKDKQAVLSIIKWPCVGLDRNIFLSKTLISRTVYFLRLREIECGITCGKYERKKECVFANNGRANICTDQIVNYDDRRLQSERFFFIIESIGCNTIGLFEASFTDNPPWITQKLYKWINRDHKRQIKIYIVMEWFP